MAEPFPLCYLNGEYLPIEEARISPFDRGFLYSGRRLRSDAGVRRPAVPLRRALRTHDAQPRRDPHGGSAHARRMARHHRDADRAQRRRRSVRLLAGDARRRARPQSRAAAGHAAHRVCVLRAVSQCRAPTRADERRGLRHGASTRAGRAATSSPCRCSRTCCCGSSRWTRTRARPSCCATAS